MLCLLVNRLLAGMEGAHFPICCMKGKGILLHILLFHCFLFFTSMTFFLNATKCFRDRPVSWQKLFQDPATSNMEGIVDLHRDICFFLLVILVLVLW